MEVWRGRELVRANRHNQVVGSTATPARSVNAGEEQRRCKFWSQRYTIVTAHSRWLHDLGTG